MKQEKEMLKQNVESYLPIFNGFYSTIFEPNEDSVIENPYKFDDYDYDYTQYRIDCAKNCVDCIQAKLEDLGFEIKITYQTISSPKYYNYTNDSIYVEYSLSKDCFIMIQNYLNLNQNKFAQYIIDNYTNYDGFISYHSNDYKEWLIDIEERVTLEHKLGSILNFILLNENFNEMELYKEVSINVSLQGKLKEKK